MSGNAVRADSRTGSKTREWEDRRGEVKKQLRDGCREKGKEWGRRCRSRYCSSAASFVIRNHREVGGDREKVKEGIEEVGKTDFEGDADGIASESADAIVAAEVGSKGGKLGGCGRRCRKLRLGEKLLEQIRGDSRKQISLDRGGQYEYRKEEASVSYRTERSLVEESRLGRLRCCREKPTNVSRGGSSRLVELESTMQNRDRNCRH